MKRIFIKIFYHIRYKYYQFQNLIKHFPFSKGEENRLQLIDSIDKLRNKAEIDEMLRYYDETYDKNTKKAFEEALRKDRIKQ